MKEDEFPIVTVAHVPASFLAAYADGSLSEGMDLVVASHLTFCPDCRAAVARLEAVGGALLAGTEPAAVSPETCAAALARLDLPEEEAAPPVPDPEGWLPYPLRQVLRTPVPEIRWSFRMPGLSEYPIPGLEDEAISLMRARPGVRVPSHTHEGMEATLVLAGAMRDGDAFYRRGDLALADGTLTHHPEIVGETVCLCLVVRQGRMHFTGRLGRALNIFT